MNFPGFPDYVYVLPGVVFSHPPPVMWCVTRGPDYIRIPGNVEEAEPP